MLEVYLRPIYQSFLVDPIARWFSNYSPMLITYLACLIGVLVAPALMYGHPSLAIFFLLVSGFLDTLDGTVARINNSVTEQGIIFDIVSDRMVEAAVIVGLFAVDPSHRAWLSLAMMASCYVCMTSFLVVGIFSPNRGQGTMQYNPGIIERAEAFVFFLLMICLPHHFSILGWAFVGFVMYIAYSHLARSIQTISRRTTYGEPR